MTLQENERIDYVNDSLSLIQKTDGLTFGTDAHSRLAFDELTQPEVYRYYINALDLQPSDMSEIVFS